MIDPEGRKVKDVLVPGREINFASVGRAGVVAPYKCGIIFSKLIALRSGACLWDLRKNFRPLVTKL